MRVIVIGCGRWGSEIARVLVERRLDVAVVDPDPRAFERLGPGFSGARVVGDGLDRAVLEQAGVEHASGLAAVTLADEINIVVARAARQLFRVPKVVARLHDPRRAEVYRRLGIETISTVAWGSQRIADLLAYSDLEVTASIGHGDVDLIEAEVPRVLAGRTVADLAIPGEAQVVALSRAGRTLLPAAGQLLEVGDRLHIVAMPSSFGRLKRLLGIV
jgi:trk system potassium uptake protein TrkA